MTPLVMGRIAAAALVAVCVGVFTFTWSIAGPPPKALIPLAIGVVLLTCVVAVRFWVFGP